MRFSARREWSSVVIQESCGLKLLLDDPGWVHLAHPRENQGVGVRVYLARRAAWQTLRGWGIDVEKPRIRETVIESLDQE